MRFRGVAWQTGACWLFPSTPSGWDIKLPGILDGEFNYFFGRKVLAHGWVNQSNSRRGSRWDGLSWSSVLLAGFLLLHLLASLVFCILIQCDFIWKLHMQWDITLFQMKPDCSCVGNIVKLHLGDNSKLFPGPRLSLYLLFLPAMGMCAGCPNVLLWKVVVIQSQNCLQLIWYTHAHPFW